MAARGAPPWAQILSLIVLYLVVVLPLLFSPLLVLALVAVYFAGPVPPES